MFIRPGRAARPLPAAAALVAFFLLPAWAQEAPAEPVDLAVLARIRDEGLNRSQLAPTLSYLTEVIGPRLTGSPGLKRANDWTLARLSEWGLVNGRLEGWGPFGRGWSCERFSLTVTGPTAFPVIALPKAWSPSVKVSGDLVLLDAADEAGLEKYRGSLKGKIVLIGGAREIRAHFTPEGSRWSDEALAALNAPAGQGRRRGAFDPSQMTEEQRREFQSRMAARQFQGRIAAFARREGAAALLDGARGDGGTIFVQQASVENPPLPAGQPPFNPDGGPPAGPRRLSPWDRDADGKIVPQIAVSQEHFNRIVRMLQAGEKVQAALELKARYHFDHDGKAFNTVAELPGSDRRDEVVMCGAHLDSWHGGTGATDNAAGVVVCMEAVRILKALGLQPRRTIRVALWSGEEQGLMGSAAYVRDHFGTRREPKAELGKVSAYFNLDNGTGKVRGIYCQGNAAVMPLFAAWLQPFADLGASAVTLRNTGGTDHQSFDRVGIPGFQFIQDEIEYDTRTHHSNQDTFDRCQIDDLKQAAVILAAFLYNAAMREEPLPRKAGLPTR